MDERDAELASSHAAPISYVGELVAASKGVKNTDPDMFNPYAQRLYAIEAKRTIDPVTAKTMLNLTRENKVPTWAIAQLDIKLIRAAAA